MVSGSTVGLHDVSGQSEETFLVTFASRTSHLAPRTRRPTMILSPTRFTVFINAAPWVRVMRRDCNGTKILVGRRSAGGY